MSGRLARMAALAGALLAPKAASAAYCPCFTASSPSNQRGCAIEAVAGINPTTAQWNDIFDLVSRGPAAWGDAGPLVDDIERGCDRPEAPRPFAARFPCELLKAIAMQESAWQHFCVPSTPADQAGQSERTIISFDCGYGVGQVTSGMRDGDTADFDRRRVAADPTYNLAAGTRILAAKWTVTACVGDRQPTVIEHWYSAAWAYNGLSYVNNPNNPNYDPGRGVWNPSIGGAAPYQERVFGWMEHTGGRWTSTPAAYPNPGDIGGDRAPSDLPSPTCASPTDCQGSRSVHVTQCSDEVAGTGGAGGAGGSEGAAGGGGSDAPATGTGGAEPGPAPDEDPTISKGFALHGRCSCDLPGRTSSDRPPWLILSAFVLALSGRRWGRPRAASVPGVRDVERSSGRPAIASGHRDH